MRLMKDKKKKEKEIDRIRSCDVNTYHSRDHMGGQNFVDLGRCASAEST